MGLDTFIFKTTKKEALHKYFEILNTKNEAMKRACKVLDDNYVILLDNNIDYMNKLKPEINWRKYNHITAWFSKNIFNNPPQKLEKVINIVCREDLIAFRRDCSKVLKHCTMPDGSLKIDENYCRKIFPYLNLAFSGNTNYDESFVDEVKIAMNNIDTLLLSSSNPETLFIIFIDY